MISEIHRERLKQVIGYHYTNAVLKILKQKKIINKKGQPHGRSMIRNVLNGINENKDIESAIWELFVSKLEKNQKIEKLKDELLAMINS